MLTDVEHLVGSQEIARLFGVSRQRVSQLVARPDFPAPTATLAMGKVWVTDEVLAWAKRSNRAITEDES
jgi:predicted DNA-binding transcriptional regulator AlpA